MTVADIHANAQRFERRARLGNRVEYIACVFVVMSFGFVALGLHPAFRHDWLVRSGAGLVLLATLYVAWQLRRRVSIRAPLESGASLVDAYRAALIRRRDALRSILTWYLAPFVPGMLVMFAGYWARKPAPSLSPQAAHYVTGVIHVTTVLVVVICALTFFIAWLINQRAADRLQRQIDEL